MTATQALGQIDENSTMPGLPNLLSPLAETCDKTKDFATKSPHCDKTPEAWPNTPTHCSMDRRRRNSFTLGDDTPEFFPEYVPSFQLQQLNGFANSHALSNVFHVAGGLPMTWSDAMTQSTGYFHNPPHTAVVGIPDTVISPHMAAIPSSQSRRHVSHIPTAKDGHLPVTKPLPDGKDHEVARSLVGKRPSVFAGQARGGQCRRHGDEAACPTAVYVDLSGLRERCPAGARARR
mmetsp:Transcript_99718/g.157839  ORF Transcript_99718/g.157839 Transcript_99718/m.157839 type:complete len:234 (-) Transcript_99718:76-777(-)